MSDTLTIAERIKLYRDSKGYGKGEFEKLCSLSNGYLNSISTPSASKLEDILNACQDLSREWVLNGIGEMLITVDPEENQPTKHEEKNEVNEPLVELILCPECILKKKRIDSWKERYYSLSEELNDVNRKYRELLEGKIETKKETTPENSAQAS